MTQRSGSEILPFFLPSFNGPGSVRFSLAPPHPLISRPLRLLPQILCLSPSAQGEGKNEHIPKNKTKNPSFSSFLCIFHNWPRRRNPWQVCKAVVEVPRPRRWGGKAPGERQTDRQFAPGSLRTSGTCDLRCFPCPSDTATLLRVPLSRQSHFKPSGRLFGPYSTQRVRLGSSRTFLGSGSGFGLDRDARPLFFKGRRERPAQRTRLSFGGTGV